jgi:phosphoribosyl 1,2-cyclic phosphate phosphodiesterase
MKVKVLGCGSAFGVPAPGGFWGDCNPDNPKNRRTRSSIVVEADDCRVLVDMSPDFSQQSTFFSIGYFDAIVFTHSHADHILGCIELPFLSAIYHTSRIQCFAHSETLKSIKKTFWYQHSNTEDESDYGEAMPSWNKIKAFSAFSVKSLTLELIPVRHSDIVPTFGYLITCKKGKRILYTPDIGQITPELEKYLDDLDAWIVNCDTLEEPRDGSHSYLYQTLEWIRKYKPKRAYLTHLDFTLDFDETSKKLPSNAALLYDGLIIDI